jgi:hypothetical protein
LNAEGIGFDDIVFSPSLERIIVPAGETGRLVFVDPATSKTESVDAFSKMPLLRGGHTQGVTSAAPALRFAAVVDRTARTLSLVDPAAKAIVATAALSAVPDYVRFDEAAGELWVTEPAAERIEIFAVDARRLPLVATIAVPGGPEHLLFDGASAYTNLWQGRTTRIDVRTRRVSASFPNGCADSRTLAIDDVRSLLFVACVEGLITSIDLSHGNRIAGRYSYHPGIDAMVYDAARGVLYAPSAAAGKMAGLTMDRDGAPRLLFEVTTVKGASCVTLDGRGRPWICDPEGGALLVASPPAGQR